MPPFLPVRAIHRSGSQAGTGGKVRIGTKGVAHNATTYVDLGDGREKRDLQRFSALGSVIVVGPLSATDSDAVVASGVQVTPQTIPDQTVDVSAGELRSRSTGAYVAVAASDNLAATAADATNSRIDIVQVNTTSGAISYKAGTAAATPSAPSPDAGNITVARVARAANDNTIAAADITDVRPRP